MIISISGELKLVCSNLEKRGWTEVNINSAAMEEWVVRWILDKDQKTLSNHINMVNWYGVWSCVRFNEKTQKIDVLGQTAKECDKIGDSRFQFKKAVICQEGDSLKRSCIDRNISKADNKGKYDYRARVTTSLGGQNCISWENMEKGKSKICENFGSFVEIL